MRRSCRLTDSTLSPHRRLLLAIALITMMTMACGSTDFHGRSRRRNPPGGGDQNPQPDTPSTLSLAFPRGLAISILPPTIPAAIPARFTTDALAETRNISDKIASMDQYLAGKASRCFDPAWATMVIDRDALYMACYKPIDGLDIVTPTDSGPNGLSNNIAGTNEPCAVVAARRYAALTAIPLENALGATLAALCQSAKDNPKAKIPNVGESIDLSDALRAAIAGTNALNVNKVSLERLADSGDRPVLKSTIQYSVTSSSNATVNLTVIHSPSSKDNSTYDGVASLTIRSGSNAPEYVTARYTRRVTAAEPRLRATVLHAVMPADSGALTDAKHLNLNAGEHAPTHLFTDSQSLAGGVNHVAIDVNPITNEGRMGLWRNIDANYFTPTRAITFDVQRQSSSSALKGCAYIGGTYSADGNGVSIRRAQTEKLSLAPRGIGGYANNAQRQCFTQGSDGRYSLNGGATETIAPDSIPPSGQFDLSGIELSN